MTPENQKTTDEIRHLARDIRDQSRLMTSGLKVSDDACVIAASNIIAAREARRGGITSVKMMEFLNESAEKRRQPRFMEDKEVQKRMEAKQ